MSTLTNDQKRRLAATLIQAAGDLIYGAVEVPARIPDDIPREAASQQLALWLKNLPGDAWDVELAPRPRQGRPMTLLESESRDAHNRTVPMDD